MTPTPLTRDELTARNLAVVADHFANENPDGIARLVAGYAVDIVWELPARGIVIRDEDEVRKAYMKLFQSMDVRSPPCRQSADASLMHRRRGVQLGGGSFGLPYVPARREAS
jgi:hypothetical protein